MDENIHQAGRELVFMGVFARSIIVYADDCYNYRQSTTFRHDLLCNKIGNGARDTYLSNQFGQNNSEISNEKQQFFPSNWLTICVCVVFYLSILHKKTYPTIKCEWLNVRGIEWRKRIVEQGEGYYEALWMQTIITLQIYNFGILEFTHIPSGWIIFHLRWRR